MENKKTIRKQRLQDFWKSTIVRIVAVIIILVLPISMITLVLSTIAVKNNQEMLTREITNSLDANMTIFKDTINRSVKRMAYLNQEDTNFVSMASVKSKSSDEQLVYMTEIKHTLDDIKYEYPWIDFLYFYYPNKDRYITCGFPGIAQTSYKEYIAENIQEKNTVKWDMTVIEETSVLYSSSQWNNACYGVMINLERLLSKMNWKNTEDSRTIFFSNMDETVMTRKGKAYLADNEISLEKIRESNKYEVIEAVLPGYDLKVVEIIDWQSQPGTLSASIIVLLVASIILAIMVIPLLLIYIHVAVSKPLHQLTGAIEKVEHGDMEYRIDTDVNQSSEFGLINQNFNNMMDEVRKLKIDVYEQELEKRDIRMRYLSQQIKPHFIMNAMNIIYSYEPEEYPLIQKMVMCISKYFRYIVKMNDRFVELHQEMDHIKNYFEIQKARYPEMFFSIVEYDDRLKHALIPPLIIQNFTENSIKYSLKIGHKVTILLIAEYIEKNDDQDVPRMRVRIADTGEGISDEVLAAIDRFQKTGVHQPELGVGTENSIARLKYLYDGVNKETSLCFWRDEVYGGTNVEIILPVYYAEEGVVYDENFVG